MSAPANPEPDLLLGGDAAEADGAAETEHSSTADQAGGTAAPNAPAADAKQSTTPPAPPAPPVEYTFTAPEGQELDAEGIAAFTPIARELGLSQEAAQKLVNLGLSRIEQFGQRLLKDQETLMAQWAKETLADPVLGSPAGRQLADLGWRSLAALGFEAPAAERLQDLLRSYGLVNNPDVNRLFHSLGKLMQEDRLTPGGSPAPQLSPSERLQRAWYPTMTKP